MTSDSWRAFRVTGEASPPPPSVRDLEGLEAHARYETPRAVADALSEIGVAMALIELATERVAFANERFAAILGRDARDLTGTLFLELVAEEDATATHYRLHAAAAPDGAPLAIRFRQLQGADAARVSADVAFRPLGRRGRYGMILMVATPSPSRGEEHALRIALEQALASLRQREDLFAFAAHELRTPLTPLMLRLQAMLRNIDRDPVALRQSLALAEAQVKRLSGLLDQFLDVARVRAGRLAIERQDVDLCEVVRGVVERFALQCARTETPIEIACPEPVVGRWDPLRLDQIVTNLVSNAVKYGAGSPVFISVRKCETHATLTVIDHGPGIAAHNLARIFDRFERANTDAKVQGAGLGLWIVRQLAQAHGGVADVISEQGRGATFIVQLPLRTG